MWLPFMPGKDTQTRGADSITFHVPGPQARLRAKRASSPARALACGDVAGSQVSVALPAVSVTPGSVQLHWGI